MDDEFSPETEPSGALQPPRKPPPTAVATATPSPPPQRHPRSFVRARSPFLPILSRALDVVDEFADAIAEALHLRPGKAP